MQSFNKQQQQQSNSSVEFVDTLDYPGEFIKVIFAIARKFNIYISDNLRYKSVSELLSYSDRLEIFVDKLISERELLSSRSDSLLDKYSISKYHKYQKFVRVIDDSLVEHQPERSQIEKICSSKNLRNSDKSSHNKLTDHSSDIEVKQNTADIVEHANDSKVITKTEDVPSVSKPKKCISNEKTAELLQEFFMFNHTNSNLTGAAPIMEEPSNIKSLKLTAFRKGFTVREGRADGFLNKRHDQGHNMTKQIKDLKMGGGAHFSIRPGGRNILDTHILSHDKTAYVPKFPFHGQGPLLEDPFPNNEYCFLLMLPRQKWSQIIMEPRVFPHIDFDTLLFLTKKYGLSTDRVFLFVNERNSILHFSYSNTLYDFVLLCDRIPKHLLSWMVMYKNFHIQYGFREQTSATLVRFIVEGTNRIEEAVSHRIDIKRS